MNILSIDVGIRNLSFCLFEYDQTNKQIIRIVKWDNINLMEKEEDHNKCIDIDKNGLLCGKSAKLIKDGKCYCVKHSKLTEYLNPIPELTNASLNKQKIDDLLVLCEKYKIVSTTDKKQTKTYLVKCLSEYAKTKCFIEIKKKNASKTNLVSIGKNIQHKLDIILEGINVDIVIIENQIGPLANKMKTIQGMLSQYFIMNDDNDNINIEFISAINKLKDYTTEKLDYKERKKLGVKVCGDFVNADTRFTEWNDFFQKHTKKDDLSDCFLQGMWYITHNFTKL